MGDDSTTSLDAFWLPEVLGVQVAVREERLPRPAGEVIVRWPILTPAELTQIVGALRRRQREVLATRTVDDIIAVLDQVAALWLDPDYPLRVKALAQIHAFTGFSPEMVAHAIELEQVSSRAGDMAAALDRELGDRRALDGFVRTAKGRTTALGHGVVGGIFSANIPALPHLTVMRSFLTKAACLGRVSRGEPAYLPLYAQSIAQVDPELASCLAVVHWDSARHDVEAAFLGGVDHLVAYGSDQTLREIAGRAPRGLPTTWHGHRMGFGYVGRDALSAASANEPEALAERLAYDFTVFDQHACLAPQAVFVQRGGAVSPEAFAVSLAGHLSDWLEKLPPRTLSPEGAATLRAALSEAVVQDAMGLGPRLLTPDSRIQGVVVLDEAERFLPSPLDRFVRVVPVDGVSDLTRYLEPVGRYLQCAAVAGITEAERRHLATLGVTRLCPPGAMGTPSMLWAHDGQPCLAALVRWCDEETVPPG